jgi:hypothetical protein
MGGDLLGIVLLKVIRWAVPYIDGFPEQIVACEVWDREKRELH